MSKNKEVDKSISLIIKLIRYAIHTHEHNVNKRISLIIKHAKDDPPISENLLIKWYLYYFSVW